MQLPDKSRKYMEVFEATGVKDGEVTGNTLFKYQVDQYERDEAGRIVKVVGNHKRLGCISSTLAERLLVGGVELKEIRRFAGNGFMLREADHE